MKEINQIIEKDLSVFLQPYKQSFVQEKFDFKIGILDNKIEITGYSINKYDPDNINPFVLLRLFILKDCRQIHISNIFLPTFMRHRTIGMHILYHLFTISKKENYELFIIDMVDSFYHKMIKKGALPCDDCSDAVQIVDNTNLI